MSELFASYIEAEAGKVAQNLAQNIVATSRNEWEGKGREEEKRATAQNNRTGRDSF